MSIYINNPLLVMAKIKLIESLRRLRSIKRMTIRYNNYCLKIKTITFGLYSPKVDLTTNSRYFPTEDIFKPHLF